VGDFCSGFGAFRFQTMPDGTFGLSWNKLLEIGLGRIIFVVSRPRPPIDGRKLSRLLDNVKSTLRTASKRERGGSISKRRGARRSGRFARTSALPSAEGAGRADRPE
jgi:hypothetical protein